LTICVSDLGTWITISICYLYEKTAIYNNAKMLCENIKPAFHLFKSPRAKINLTRICLITAHATLTHTIFSSRGTAGLKKRRASCGDRLTSNLKSYNIEKSVRSRVFVNKINKKGWNKSGEIMWAWGKSTFWKGHESLYILKNAKIILLLIWAIAGLEKNSYLLY
jgi:hypothetical protein